MASTTSITEQKFIGIVTGCMMQEFLDGNKEMVITITLRLDSGETVNVCFLNGRLAFYIAQVMMMEEEKKFVPHEKYGLAKIYHVRFIGNVIEETKDKTAQVVANFLIGKRVKCNVTSCEKDKSIICDDIECIPSGKKKRMMLMKYIAKSHKDLLAERKQIPTEEQINEFLLREQMNGNRHPHSLIPRNVPDSKIAYVNGNVVTDNEREE